MIFAIHSALDLRISKRGMCEMATATSAFEAPAAVTNSLARPATNQPSAAGFGSRSKCHPSFFPYSGMQSLVIQRVHRLYSIHTSVARRSGAADKNSEEKKKKKLLTMKWTAAVAAEIDDGADRTRPPNLVPT